MQQAISLALRGSSVDETVRIRPNGLLAYDPPVVRCSCLSAPAPVAKRNIL
jgi:hypothetical protein